MSFVRVASLSEIPVDRGLRVRVAFRKEDNRKEGNARNEGNDDPDGDLHNRTGQAEADGPETVDVGLYRIGDTVHAMEDVCPHAGFPLSRGCFENGVVVCDAHGWPFDVRTGFDPDHGDGFPIPCFAVRVVGDDVEIDLEERTNDPRRTRTRD